MKAGAKIRRSAGLEFTRRSAPELARDRSRLLLLVRGDLHRLLRHHLRLLLLVRTVGHDLFLRRFLLHGFRGFVAHGLNRFAALPHRRDECFPAGVQRFCPILPLHASLLLHTSGPPRPYRESGFTARAHTAAVNKRSLFGINPVLVCRHHKPSRSSSLRRLRPLLPSGGRAPHGRRGAGSARGRTRRRALSGSTRRRGLRRLGPGDAALHHLRAPAADLPGVRTRRPAVPADSGLPGGSISTSWIGWNRRREPRAHPGLGVCRRPRPAIRRWSRPRFPCINRTVRFSGTAPHPPPEKHL